MKIFKKILPVIAILALLSSCGIFKGGHDGSRHCDCPKFGEQVQPQHEDAIETVNG